MKHRARKAGYEAFWKPYFDSWPTPESNLLLTQDTFEEGALPYLQDETMAALVKQHQGYTRSVYEGKTQYASKHLVKELGRAASFEEFRHTVAMVNAYPFTRSLASSKTPKRVMLPMADILNHANEEQANVASDASLAGGFFEMSTTREVRKGEELVHSYSSQLKRPDFALFHYGFVEEDAQPPRLAVLDIPGGDLYDDFKFDEQGPEYRSGGVLASEAEVQRLEAKLASFPTTAEEDKALLRGEGALKAESEALTECRRLAVRFRLVRKEALAYWAERLRAVLAEDEIVVEEEEEAEEEELEEVYDDEEL